MFDQKTCSLVVPSEEGKKPILLPLTKIYETESRIQEVATVNAHKAPELLAAFNIAYLDIRDYIVRLHLCLADAESSANTRKSIVILDIVPQVLRDKGIASARSPGGSEDQREAVLAQDAEYLKRKDRIDIIKAIIELLEGKKIGIEWAYTSVKKILGGETNWADMNKNRNLSVPAEHPPMHDPNSPRNRFGGG
jgi:hypothetical protein